MCETVLIRRGWRLGPADGGGEDPLSKKYDFEKSSGFLAARMGALNEHGGTWETHGSSASDRIIREGRLKSESRIFSLVDIFRRHCHEQQRRVRYPVEFRE